MRDFEIEVKSRWRRVVNLIAGSSMVLIAMAALFGAGCAKKTVKLQVPSRILKAKTATFQQLVILVNDYSNRIQSLSSTAMRVTFRSGKLESGKLQQYRSVPGYVLLRRPDSIRLNVQNPLMKTPVLELASIADPFSLWIPSENRFFVGKNSIKELGVEGESASPTFTARPIDIFQAILQPRLPIGVPGYRIAMEEDQDAAAKYYVLSAYEDAGNDRLTPVRKFWIERADLVIARQQTYDGEGTLTGIIHYANFSPAEGLLLPLSIRIERPLDGYSLDMEFRNWRMNPKLPDDAFILTPPPGARRIQLIERAKSKDS